MGLPGKSSLANQCLLINSVVSKLTTWNATFNEHVENKKWVWQWGVMISKWGRALFTDVIISYTGEHQTFLYKSTVVFVSSANICIIVSHLKVAFEIVNNSGVQLQWFLFLKSSNSYC